MKNIQLFFLSVTFSFLISCNKNETKQITNSKEYQAYLQINENSNLQSAKAEYNFWNQKLEANPNQYPYQSKLASANSQIFQLTGNIYQLKEAEKNLITANKQTNYKNWTLESPKPKEIGILAKRIENVPGTHKINYESEVDSISIKHTAQSREGFALGAVIAAEWIHNKTGVFTMKDVLNIG